LANPLFSVPIHLFPESSIAVDSLGNKWIGTSKGLAKFDGITWTVYTTSNSGLYDNSISSIAIDIFGIKWIGTHNGGISKFDETSWMTYLSYYNSKLPNNDINSIVIDYSGNKWIGTQAGFAKFDGSTWTVYNNSNSALTDNRISSIGIDASGNKWIGTVDGGLYVYGEGGIVSVKEDNKNISPTEFLVSQNYPNPFNPKISIAMEEIELSYNPEFEVV